MRKIILIMLLFYPFLLLQAQDAPKQNVAILESNFIASSSLVYDHLFPIKDYSSIMLGAAYVMGTGFGYGDHAVSAQAGFSLGGPRNLFEIQAVYWAFFNNDPIEEGDNESCPGLKLAWRYEHHKGISFRLSMYLLTGVDPPILPSIGLGYAF